MSLDGHELLIGDSYTCCVVQVDLQLRRARALQKCRCFLPEKLVTC